MATKQMKVFEYVIFWTPTDDQAKDGKKAEILVQPKVILAADPQTAQMQAARDIPESHVGELDQIVIALRSF